LRLSLEKIFNKRLPTLRNLIIKIFTTQGEWDNSQKKIWALCQMMLVKRNLRIIGDQVDQFLLIFFS
ncbi:TPA: hypothetical protein ACKFSF_002746, partial [Enterococcus faecium]